MNKLPLLFLSLVFSCATIDVEKEIKPSVETGKQISFSETQTDSENDSVTSHETVIIEKPIYMPEGKPAPAPPQGRASVEAANKGIIQPKDYENAAMLYDYHRDFVYELYCRPLRVSDITLQAGEKTAEPPFISDSERWMLGAGVSYEDGIPVQHIYVKPTAVNLHATLIINTNVRVYHLILRSFQDVHMPIVRWRYHETSMPQNYIKPPESSAGGETPFSTGGEDSIDPSFLSFDYRITYGIFSKPRWLPSLACDDGKKTYITFPETALQGEMPAVFENRGDVINYRVARNVLIIDKLIEKVSIKLGDSTVTVEKKRGAR